MRRLVVIAISFLPVLASGDEYSDPWEKMAYHTVDGEVPIDSRSCGGNSSSSPGSDTEEEAEQTYEDHKSDCDSFDPQPAFDYCQQEDWACEVETTDYMEGSESTGWDIAYSKQVWVNKEEEFEDPNPCDAYDAEPLGTAVYDEPYLPSQACDNGCQVLYSGSVTANEVSGDGDDAVYYFEGVSVSGTGDSCTVGEGGLSESADELGEDAPECADNETLGTVNGEWSCQPKGSDDPPDDGSGDDGSGDDGSGDDGSGDDGAGDDGSGDDGSDPDGDTTDGEVTLEDGSVQEVELDTEGLAQEDTTRDIRDGVEDLTDDDGATDEPKDMFRDSAENEWDNSGVDDAVEEAKQGEPKDGIDAKPEAESFKDQVQDVIPDVGCSGISVELMHGYTWGIDCSETEQIRSILSWVLYALTAIAIFQLFTETGGGKR